MIYIILFFTHSGTIKYHRFLQTKGVSNEMMPVPRELSSSCGVAVKITTEFEFKPPITPEVAKIYEQKKDGYQLLFTRE